MIDAALSSIRGFVTGKLFANPAKAYGLLGLGIAATAAVVIVVAKLGVPLYGTTAIAGFLGGMLQPRLYKTLKYR
jgi:hypothetical protein